MALDKRFYIHTGSDGTLSGMSEDDVTALVADLKTATKVVFHVHGGLINKSAALEKAERLIPLYEAAGARPVFLVWESGFVETVRNNLHEIEKEKIFWLIVKQALKFAVGKLSGIVGAKGQLTLPTDIEVNTEIEKRHQSDPKLPYEGFEPSRTGELTEAERKRFERSLVQATEFQREVRGLAASAAPEETQSTAKGITAVRRKSAKTLMSPEVVDELAADTTGGRKGVITTAAIVIRAGRALTHVISRVRRRRDHGLYATVIEEVLRELYIANVGSWIWGAMKKETEDAFANVGKQPIRAGWFLVQQLGALVAGGHRPDVSIVAHSAGSIYACHLLAHLAWARGEQAHPLPADFRLKHLIFLAPACSFGLFDRALAAHRLAPLFDSFRMFALRDELEAGYWEIPPIYPRSLLYFVSGVVEKENGNSAQDLPLLGMQRYFTDTATYTQAEVGRVRDFFVEESSHGREVWSQASGGDGLASDAITHGGFDSSTERGKAMQSVRYILQASS